MTIYGYARVSTRGQELDIQLEKLRECGIEEKYIYREKFTGKTTNRPQFKRLIRRLKAHDVLVVTRLDRLARNTREALNIIEPLMESNVTVRVLNIGTIENSSIGRFFMRTLLSLAEMERDMIVERIQEGKEKARADPNYREGRPRRKITKEYRRAYNLLADHSYAEVSELTGISKGTLLRIKKQIEQ
jgi:DNA invertase Pin-like site-specific DNA recombinase